MLRSARILTAVVATAVLVARPGVARAGMPSFTLADVGRSLALSQLTRARLEAISFFVAALLVCAGIIQGLWNLLRKDVPRLPRLSYGKACGVVMLWGLLFVLVLTMISGARELLTPGAWEKSGWTYRLANDPAEAATRQIAARHDAMQRLRDALDRHAYQHGGAYPECTPPCTWPRALESISTLPGHRYVYRGGRKPADDDFSQDAAPLLYEADTFGPDRLVILTDGEIIWMPAAEVERAARSRTP